MPNNSYNSNTLFSIQIILGQYPILRDRISEYMYNRLIQDGFITFTDFEERVRDFALMSQKREGLQNPFAQEGQNVWENRLQRVREQLINIEFSQHYPLDVFSELVDAIVQNRQTEKQPLFMWHNLEFASVDTIFEQALAIERRPAAERKQYEATLMGAKVVLIRKMISSQLQYIEIAKKIFSIRDLIEINKHRIGKGCIGGKSAGMILSRRILQDAADEEIRSAISDMESYFIGADEYFSFLSINDLLDLLDSKYGDEDELQKRYPEIVQKFIKGNFQKEIVDSLGRVIHEINGKPFIVRSSSLLEDSFGHAFTGMYESFVIPNQGSPEEGLQQLQNAIRKIYASSFDPKVLAYRSRNGLIDYRESMGILIQVIAGNHLGNFLFPDVAGIGSSKTAFIWHGEPYDAAKDEGFLRMVFGMGTRAKRRTGNDFPQIVVLNDPCSSKTVFSVNNPLLSQSEIDVINLKTNEFQSLDIEDVLNEKYPILPWVAQAYQNDTLQTITRGIDPDRYVINFRELVKKTSFTRLMRDMLQLLERTYKNPVFIEFTVLMNLDNPGSPNFQIQIDKCRPINISEKMKKLNIFEPVSQEKILLSTNLFVQNGLIKDVDYIVYVDPDEYKKLPRKDCAELPEMIGLVNRALLHQRFIILGMNRWGTSGDTNGLPVRYGDISNTLALIEISGYDPNKISDPPMGTQIYQNLLEAGIFMILLNRQSEEGYFDENFFKTQQNVMKNWCSLPEKFEKCIRLLPTSGYHNSQGLDIALNQELGKTIIYFK